MDTGVSILQVVFAFLLVVALIGMFGIGLRRFSGSKRWLGAVRADARVKIVETCYLDPRRRLVLVKRDDVEHLVLIAPESQMVIESDIRSAMK